MHSPTKGGSSDIRGQLDEGVYIFVEHAEEGGAAAAGDIGSKSSHAVYFFMS